MRSFAAYFRPATVVVLLILTLGAHNAIAQTASGVTASPVALSYGVPAGSTYVIPPSTAPASSPENVTVNITCSTAPCSSVTFSGATIGASNPPLGTDNPGDFVVEGVPSCSGTLTSPNTCQVSLYYNAGLAPATTLETALLTISSSAGNLTVPLSGAYGSIKLFDETNITSNSSPYTIASKQLNLSCPVVIGGPPTPTGIISGTPDGKGNVLVDSYITLATGPALSPVNNNTPAGNLCSDGGDCFTFNYEDALFNEPGVVVNADPDSFANANSILPGDDPSNGAGGISPINVQSFLTGNPPGVPLYPEQALFTLLSDGEPADYGNSTLFLQTNCTAPGIIPGASVTLNPINTSNPATLTQTADLDNSPGQNISFTTSSAVANQQIQGLVSNGVVQVITDYPVPQQLFNQLVDGTSAAPSVCMRLTGEQDSNGNPMCKGFLLQCYTPGASGAKGVPSGDNCYNADALTEQAQRYLLFTSQFTSPDGPSGYNFLTNQQWIASNAYTLGQTIVDQSGDVQQVTTAGNSGSGPAPLFNDGIVGGVPATTQDGTVIWTFQGVNACLNVANGGEGPTICAQGTGPGLLMGGDNWLCPTDAPCTPPTTSVSATSPTSPATYNVASCAFDTNGGLNGDLCPLDVMTSFQGAADAAPKGTSKISNSLFIPVVNQPLPSATANPGSGFIGQWTNTPASATISFAANPATYPNSGAIPGSNSFKPASIYSVTGGLTTFGQPLPDTTYPVTGDYSVLNNGSGGAGASPTSPFCTSTPSAPTFSTSPSLVNLNNNSTPADGIYNVHYFATDCALTEGLVYSPTPAQVTDATANWASFPFATIGVDTAAPTVSCSQIPASPTSSGWYGSNVTVNCNVMDQNFNSDQESGPLTGSGFAPAVNGIQGSGSEIVTASTNVAVGSAMSASTGTPTPSPCDQAGNCASGIPTGPFMIDLQSPTITTSGTPYSSTVGGSTIAVSFTCNDGMGSGIQTCNISATPANFVPNSPFCSPSSGEVVTCGGTIPTTTAESGTLTISATDNVGNASQAMVPFTVNQEPLTITASNTAFIFGGTPVTPTALYTYGSVVQSATAPAGLTPPTCSTTATSTTPAGTVTGANTCSGAASSNYSISYVSGNAVVSAEPLTITASNTSFTQGSTPPNPTPLYTYGTISLSSVTPAGLTPPTCTTTVNSSTAPGTYPGANTCSGAAGSNYAIGYVAGTATVNPPAVWTITPSTYNFGDLSIGESASYQFTITNPGTSAVAITVSVPQGGYGNSGQSIFDPDDFKITSNNCPKTLGGGLSCNVTVTYKADQDDFHGVYAYLTVCSGKTVLAKAEMLGKAVDPIVKMSSTSFNFGSQTTGSPITEQVLTLTNTGPTTLLIHDLVLNGSGTFKLASGTNECMNGGSVAAGATCEVYVTFTPAKKGSTYSASICISGNEADGPLNLSLKGTGD